MKSILIAFLITLGLSACDGKPAASQPAAQEAPSAEIQKEPAKPDHNYAMKDGFEYGYEPALSENDLKSGQAATQLMMFKFAGKKDGQYQVYMKKGAATVVAQCGNPCDFIKTMTFFQHEHIKTERMRATPGLLVWMVMEDAINGKMEQWVPEKGGKKGSLWFTENGPKFTPNK